jgi:hypothetical protein
MRISVEIRALIVTLIWLAIVPIVNAQSFTMEQIKSYPFPNELTAAATGSPDRMGLQRAVVCETSGWRRTRLQGATVDEL